MFPKAKWCFLILIFLPITIDGYKVLIAIPSIIKSLHSLFSHIGLGLADAGHNVTFVSAYPLHKEHKNVEMITFTQIQPIINAFSLFDMRSMTNMSELLSEMLPKVVDALYTDERAMSLWKRRKEYDLFLAMSYFSEIVYPFLMDSPATFVQVCTPGVESVSLSREGNWLTPAVVPSILLNYDEYMTFWERVINLPAVFSYYYFQHSTLGTYTPLLKKYFPDFDPSLDYYNNVALTLINGHFALDGPVPLLPSQIEIGTINIKKSEPLDKDLEEFFQGSGDAGVIYFSLGSIANSKDIPMETKNIFLEVFRRVPQRVVWKYEATDLVFPPNVLVKKWMPQQDILGHPKTKLFISHCGNLGTQEAKYHGVPVLGLPIAFDQPRNAARMERKGYAKVIQWEELSVEYMLEAVNTIINDTSYGERIKNVSRILQDQKDTPVERAVWWMEYVVRHNGAQHLHYAGRRLSLFQYIMLDVLLFWAAAISVVVFAFIYLIRITCWRWIFGKPQSLKKKKE